MRHLGLFEGIGGFSLAARWAGWETVAWCEINPFCQRVLNHHFPKAIQHDDIKTTDFSIYRAAIDIITGGFPCQPYSTAGKRLGKEDDRHLWPEMLRCIREVKPRWIVGENVRGIVSWNGGMVFEEVQSDLEAEGYEVQSFILPAAGVGAPHRRDRVWFIAYSNNAGRSAGLTQIQVTHGKISERNNNAKSCNASDGIPTNANSYQRLKGRGNEIRHKEAIADTCQCNAWKSRGSWKDFLSQSPICGRDDGLPTELDGITFSKWRNESIKAYGNAIVPQVAYQIFKSINQYEHGHQEFDAEP